MMPTHLPNPYGTNRRTAQFTTSRSAAQKVVVVNSSPEILTLAERVLANGNYDVVFVEAVGQAYAQIRRVRPNLVILCLRLGDQNGFQLLSMLKLDPETKEIPVLTYTAEEESAHDVEEAGRFGREFFATHVAVRMN